MIVVDLKVGQQRVGKKSSMDILCKLTQRHRMSIVGSSEILFQQGQSDRKNWTCLYPLDLYRLWTFR